MNQISILGCGWLGFPLALSLQRKGYSIKGSTTSDEKKATLQAAQIDPYLIHLTESGVTGDFAGFVEGSETLIINVPPGMRRDPTEAFSKKIKKLIPLLERTTLKQLLFVSSTSVFSDHQGEVNESNEPQPDTLSGKELLKTEQLLNANTSFKTTIVRFGGLIGEDRHPINYFSGRVAVPGGNAPVNLIHLEDCIGIIQAILETACWGKTVHGVHPHHPKKSEYYTQQAKEKNLPSPHFEKEVVSQHKIIWSTIVSGELGYEFQKTL